MAWDAASQQVWVQTSNISNSFLEVLDADNTMVKPILIPHYAGSTFPIGGMMAMKDGICYMLLGSGSGGSPVSLIFDTNTQTNLCINPPLSPANQYQTIVVF
jgi:hypothetical protein